MKSAGKSAKKSAPSLREIEQTMTRLWLNRQANDWLSSDAGFDELPAEIADLDKSIIKELDRKGAGVYARGLNYEYQDMADCIFPYCAKALDHEWEGLVESYYKKHPSRHFDFNQVCVHFSAYLESADCADVLAKFPYLAELADYEWLEQAKAEEGTRIERAADVQISGLEQIIEYFPVVNQTLVVRHYQYPIAEIAHNFEEDKEDPQKSFEQKPCIMAIYRDPETHRTRFMNLGEATAAIIEAAKEKPSIYQELLKITLSLTPELQATQAVLEFLTLIEGLHKDNIFVGSHRIEVKHVI